MTDFELILAIDSLSDELEDRVCDEFDALVGGHGKTTLLTVTAEGPDAVSGGKRMVRKLARLGVTVRRFHPDLVTRKSIAARAGVTPQGVGLWIRGERYAQHEFPEPYVLAGGGMWLWGDVNLWLKARDWKHDEMEFPTRMELDELNYWLSSGNSAAGMSQVVIQTTESVETQFVGMQGDYRSAASSYRVDFALSA